MPPSYSYIEIPHRHMPIPNDDLPVSVDVALSVGLAFDDDARMVNRFVTELIVTVDDLAEAGRRSIRIPVDFTDDLIAALQAAASSCHELHLHTPMGVDDDSDAGPSVTPTAA